MRMSRAACVHVASGAVGLGLSLFAVAAVHAFDYAPQSHYAPQSPLVRSPVLSVGSAAAAPARIVIPSIGVNARVEALGLTASGNMAAPASFGDAGWYRYGPVPGSTGSAVIAGHLDNGLGFDGVFKNLDALQAGDIITVVSRDGTRQTFEVVGKREYPYTAVPDSLLFATSGPPRLVLVTCAGALLYLKRTYDRRLVVFARPLPPMFSPVAG